MEPLLSQASSRDPEITVPAPPSRAGGMYRLKRRIFDILGPKPSHDQLARGVNLLLLTLILLNVAAIMAETVESLRAQYEDGLLWFEAFSVGVFSLELLLRIWVIDLDPRFSHPLTGRLRFLLTPMAIVDVLAVVPFYLPFVHADFRYLRVLRFLRVFRVLKLARYSRALCLITTALREVREQLVVSLGALAIVVVVVATLMYHAEHDAQPEVFSSIPASLWWTVVTVTTVGYGDVYPITVTGRFLGGALALLGIAAFAVPAGMVGSAFAEALAQSKSGDSDEVLCPHCGHRFNPEAKAGEHAEPGD